MSKTTILLVVPGYADSGPEHWQSLWQAKYPHSVRAIQDHWEDAECDAWVQRLEETVHRIEGSVVIAAHSLGCTTVIFWAHRYKKSTEKVKGALLVAPCDPFCLPARTLNIQGFEDLPLEKLPFPSIVVTSINDPYLSLERAHYFADSWGSKLVNVGAKGHIGSDSNVGEWKEGQALLKTLLSI